MPSAGRAVRLSLQVVVALAAVRSVTLLFGYFVGVETRRHHVEASLFILALASLACWLALPRAEDMRPVPSPERWTVIAATLGAGAFALYWPSLSIGLLSDDFVLLDWAARGVFAPPHYEFVRPVPLMLWRVLQTFGTAPVVLHAINVVLHAVNAALTAAVGRRLGLTSSQAFAASVVFLVWPTQVEAVAWSAGIFDVLMTTAVLTAVALYAASAGRFTAGRTVLIAAMLAIALLSKETAVALPALIAVISAPRWMKEGLDKHERYVFGLLTASCAGYLAWRVFLRTGGQQALPALSRYVMKEQISRTFGTLAVPSSIAWIAAAPLAVAGLASGLLAALAVPMALRSTRTAGDVLVISGLAWCLVATAPAVGYLFVGPHLEGSRYLYLALSGWAIALASRFPTGGRACWLAVSAGVVAIGLCVAQARLAMADWEEAGRQRDVILANARAVAADCANATFTAVPEGYRGAQLFRNGFPEALARASHQDAKGSEAGCAFEWYGSAFRRR